ncbi:MAG: type II toxin-antitoxin system HipA family toxin [Trueperaceae bacterium]
MTSRSCYVYIQMPGILEIATCGRFQLDHREDGTSIGRFVYGQSYLQRADAVPLDPYHLPLIPREFTTTKLGGLFGALRDVAPDFWGRRVIERRIGEVDPTEFDYLVHPADGRIGALSFGDTPQPQQQPSRLPSIHDLARLREAAAAIEAGEPIEAEWEDLLRPGSSVGGARPKTVIRLEDGTVWIAKFPERSDRWSNAAVEGGMLALAKQCGIETPETRIEVVGGEQVLLVKRFDRSDAPGGDGELRSRMVSALTVLDLDESVTERSGWSYLDLADEIQRWSEQPVANKRELFRRMTFNALVSNTDDHPRNHALIAPGRGWRLSPAYDITPSHIRSLERRDLAMSVGVQGRLASRQNLLSEVSRFGWAREEADRTIDKMKHIVSTQWWSAITKNGGSKRDCEAVAGAFVYDGFEQPAPV